MEALMPFGILAKPGATGVSIASAASCATSTHQKVIMITPQGSGDGNKKESDLAIPIPADGSTVVEREVHILRDGAQAEVMVAAAHGENLPHVMVMDDAAPGPGQKRIKILANGPARDCKLNADGSLHRDLTLSIEENGVTSQGRLILDVTGAKAQ